MQELPDPVRSALKPLRSRCWDGDFEDLAMENRLMDAIRSERDSARKTRGWFLAAALMITAGVAGTATKYVYDHYVAPTDESATGTETRDERSPEPELKLGRDAEANSILRETGYFGDDGGGPTKPQTPAPTPPAKNDGK